MQVNNDEYNVTSTTCRKRRRQDDWDDDLSIGSDEYDSDAKASEIKKRNFAFSEGANDVLVNSCPITPPPVSARILSKAYGSWHHGAISRKHAEALLSGSPDGVFLVRDSVTFPGDLTLSVRCRGRVIHYRVKCRSRDQRLTLDNDSFFENMIDLIEYYSIYVDGLCTKLERWLPKCFSQRHHSQ